MTEAEIAELREKLKQPFGVTDVYLYALVPKLLNDIEALRKALEAYRHAEGLETELGQNWRTMRAYKEAAELRDAAIEGRKGEG